MASLMVGGAFLSAFLQVLFDRLASKEILDLFRGKKPVIDVLDELNTVLISANKLISDAEEKQIMDEEVRKWLDKLNDVVYHADDLVDTINSEALRRKMEGDDGSSSSTGMSKVLNKLNIRTELFSGFDYTVKNEATEILRRLKSLLEQKDNLGLREGVEKLLPSQREPAPLVEESGVFGRMDEKEAIVASLLSNDGTDDKISIIPIVGMGGIGKTTLAQVVLDDDRVKTHFDVRAWVTISDKFDVTAITKKLLERVTSSKVNEDDLVELQRKLKVALSEKRFLFVLDDDWNENYHFWRSLRCSFDSGASGSKIIVTARSTTVASVKGVGRTHRLSNLLLEDGFRLFASHAFTNKEDLEAHQHLHKIGEEIVNKCKGLPLAIISLAGLLRSERNQKKWDDVLISDVWNELYRKEDNNILPALWLSYRHMPTHLKRCFSYCSMFHKDYEFEKERIILLWMAEGFLHCDKQSTTMEELGEEYIEDLISRSLFQKSSSQGESIFVMHDLVHDLAMFVSGGFCFRLDESNDLHNLASQTRYLSHSYKSTEFEGIRNAKCLRTFIKSSGITIINPPPPHLHHEFLLTTGRYLRVLCLHGSPIKELPSSIGNLIHLRYLDLSGSNIKALPDSVCSLYNLQTLLLSWCRSLKALPKNMERLINLRHLDIERTPLQEMEFQIKYMKSLQTISKIVVGDGNRGNKIPELKEIKPFIGKLEISRIENIGEASEALAAGLKDNKDLLKLSLMWSSESADNANNSEKEREIMDALRPHTNMKNLTIFSDWVGHDSFSNVVSISMISCKSCCFLPPLGQLLSLKELYITGFDSMVSVGEEFYGNTSPSFRCLERLDIYDMPLWKEWSFYGDDRVVFPRLSHLELSGCPELNNILKMENPSASFPSLVFLSVNASPVLNSLPELVPLSKLKEFWVIECIKHLQWDLQRLSSLESFYIYDYEADSFPQDGILLPPSLSSLTIHNCKELVALNGSAFQQLTSLTELTIHGCPQLRCLPEEGLPASLSLLEIGGCNDLLKQRCEKEKGEYWPKIAHIPHVYLES